MGQANETTLKGLGDLADHRVVYFATHGVTAAQSANRLKINAEPGLIMAGPDGGDRA